MKLFDFGAVIIIALLLGFGLTQAAQTPKGQEVVKKVEAKAKPYLDKVTITAPYISPSER